MSAPLWFDEPLVPGDSGRAVDVVRRKLGLVPGVFDAALSAAVRAFQRGARLPMTGVVDEETAAALGEREGFGLLPPWWEGTEISEVDPLWKEKIEPLIGPGGADALRRFQGRVNLLPSGVVDESTARILYGLE